ncbi:MAG: large subunit ribosomal protein [Thermoanaerobaculia bacterium]|nr:large subunit ribosomal protein [Thermoanaerobaculia bacterium]
MRHGMVNRKLGRTSAHRNALFRNQLASLIDKERIITTLPKAKELRPQIERLITLARTDSVHNRRQAVRVVDETMVAKLFDTLGPRFADRPGGYTRIIKLGPRRGDAAEIAILEFVDFKLDTEPKEEAPAKKAKAAPKKAKAKAEADEDEEEAPKKKKPAAKKAAPKKKEAAEKPKKKTTTKKKAK